MRKSFIKNPSYISGIIALLFIITISLFIVIILIDEYDFYINLFFLFVLLVVYLPSILTLNSNETIELEYRKEIVLLLIDNCNEKVKEYLVKYVEKK